VLVHLNLGDAFRESLSVSPMDLDAGDDLILGWDWISLDTTCGISTGRGRWIFGLGRHSFSWPSSRQLLAPRRRPSPR
jgi:hypothetical protein